MTATVCPINPPGHDWEAGLACRWCDATRTPSEAVLSGLASVRGWSREAARAVHDAALAEAAAEALHAAADEIDRQVPNDERYVVKKTVVNILRRRANEHGEGVTTPLIVARFDTATEPALEEEAVLTVGCIAEDGRPVALLLDLENRSKVARWLAPELEEATAAAATATPDTLAAWLRQRFTASCVSWDNLDDTERDYWEHQALAVRRAVQRGGFRTATPEAGDDRG
jgi:hypothetical protein